MSIVINKVQREIVCFSSVPNLVQQCLSQRTVVDVLWRISGNHTGQHSTRCRVSVHVNGRFPTLNLATWLVMGHTPWCVPLHRSWIKRWFSEFSR